MKDKKYQICTKCVMDTTDPDITFSENGVCSHCSYYDTYEQKHMLKGLAAEAKTNTFVQEMKEYGKGKEYDCIMGLSGGVDSSYLAWYATKILGLRPLVVHVDSGWNSELAVNNIENIVKKLGLDLHTLVLDWEEIRDLQLSFFKASVPNCDIPQDHAFIAGLFSEARKYGIKYMLNGGNMATESILPKAWGYSASDLIHIKDIHSKFGTVKLKTYPTINYYEKMLYYPYVLGLKVIRPLEYIPYNKAEVKEFLKKELGWRDYGGKHYESTFTKFFQAHYLPSKFGYDKRRAHLASLIVSGQMTREEALNELNLPLYEAVDLQQDMEFFVKKLGINMNEFKSILALPPKTEDDYRTEKKLHKVTQMFYKIAIGVLRKIKK
jgi:N-acetyl sugar amidotransferase